MGKSTMVNNEIISVGWNNPGFKIWFISPTYHQAKIQYRRMLDLLSTCPNIVKYKSETELRILLLTGSEIVYKSGEVFDKLRGETLNFVAIDEVRDQPDGLWTQVIQSMLRTTKGKACFTSTPNGFDSFFDLYCKEQTDSDNWQSFSGASTCNPLFSQEEFEQARKEMSDSEFAQEIMAEFRDIGTGKAYLNHGAHNWKMESPFTRDGSVMSPHLPILVGLDFNVNPMCWHLGQENQGVFYWFDRIFMRNVNTQDTAVELIGRIKGHAPGAIICGDSTGSARRSSASQSDYAIIEQALQTANIKYENRTPTSNPTQKDRVNSVNASLKSADGTVRLFYHPERCPELKKDFERVVWKQGAQFLLDKTNPDLTHASDSVGYSILELSNKWQPSPGLMRVITR